MRLLTTIAACSILGACGSVGAAVIDPADDVHCSVVAFHTQGLAKHRGAPADQQRAAWTVHEWYAAKMRAVADERWGGTSGFEKEVAPLLEAVKSDPQHNRDEMMACAERAVADPEFDDFARKLGKQRS